MQRTVKRNELKVFLCLLRNATGPTTVHVDNKRMIGGLWRGEMKCIEPKAKESDLWILIWEDADQSQ